MYRSSALKSLGQGVPEQTITHIGIIHLLATPNPSGDLKRARIGRIITDSYLYIVKSLGGARGA